MILIYELDLKMLIPRAYPHTKMNFVRSKFSKVGALQTHTHTHTHTQTDATEHITTPLSRAVKIDR